MPGRGEGGGEDAPDHIEAFHLYPLVVYGGSCELPVLAGGGGGGNWGGGGGGESLLLELTGSWGAGGGGNF